MEGDQKTEPSPAPTIPTDKNPESKPTSKRRPPPVENRWKKGQSGNPGGRKKGRWDIDVVLRKLLGEMPEGETGTAAEILADRYLKALLKGPIDDRLFKIIAERVCGLPKQTIRQEVPVSYHLTLEQIEPDSPEALAAQTPEDDDSDLEEVPTDNDEPAIGGHDA